MPMIENDEFTVSGLQQDVEIIVDEWGVPHIYASNRDDLFLAQGFNAARDRLYQIDLWRRRGLGHLSEVFGPAYAEQDRANRLFLYRGDMRSEWLAYGTSTRQTVTSFVHGINAYVAWVGKNPEALPPEFVAYGYTPAAWRPEDVILFRTHGLFYNAEQELARALAIRDFGERAEMVRQPREPNDPLTVPDGTDLTLLNADILRDYRLAFSPVDFSGAARPESWVESLSGSNNWAVSADRTSTGRPILANDPHRAVTLPSLRYIAHLDAPGFSVIGGGEPALPGISIGHNGKVAFGLTIWPADHEDIYLYELDPDDSDRYRYGDGWERFCHVTEQLDVAGETPREIELEFTRHGPMIYRDVERGFAVAVRAVWLQPGMAPYLASLEYQNATNADDFVTALERWGAPALNHVYATTDGDIGWQTAALIPRRIGWDGSLPVPGDGRYEWDGFATFDHLPSERNPSRGWVASANQMNLPESFDNRDLTTTYDWYSGARYERLVGWLDEQHQMSVADSVTMQSDSLSIHAREFCARLSPVPGEKVRDGDTLARLVIWDGNETADSWEALVFEVWLRRHLRPWLIEHELMANGFSRANAEQAVPNLLRDESFASDLRGDLLMIRAIDWTSRSAVAELTSGIDSTLHAALKELDGLLGSNRANWRWGALHHSLVVHAALSLVDGIAEDWKRIGPLERGGSGDTVGNAGYNSAFQQTIGSTFRVVLDVGEWDSSRAMNSPGQSGDPRSPHYRDLFAGWAAGDSFPLSYSRAAVESHAASRIMLRANP